MDNIICIAGPTASGKTALSIELAKQLSGEIVSCDSMQVYRRMDIGTAKPTREEMQGIPHHMIDVCQPEEDFSVSKYCDMATPIVEDILARGKTAIIVGGTGLYMDNLIKGTSFAPFPATGRREELEEKADREGMEAMMALLSSIDPACAARLHISDRKRIIRALEIFYETGETMTAHDEKSRLLPPKFDPLWIGLDFEDRQELYRRIDLRVEIMLRQGLVKEIEDLLESGISPRCTAMQAIGYKEFVDAITGRCSFAEATAQVQQSSRRYAKRQLTWFRRNKSMHWLVRDSQTPTEKILEDARQLLLEYDK